VRLSLAMIVKNEQERLAHSLESVQGLVDEIVVVDTGSTDRTVEIARAHGARVEFFPWGEDFAAARNAALGFCTGEWILVLDADESIDARDHGLLREALEAPGVQGYALWIRNYLRSGAIIGGEGVAQRNDGLYQEGSQFSHHCSRRGLRLFRAQSEPVYRGRIHELAELYFEERSLSVQSLEAVIHHFGKTDWDRDRAKQAGYLQIAKAEAHRCPQEPQAHYNVLQEALMVEDWPAALGAAEAFLRLQGGAPLLVYLGAAKALQGQGRHLEALDYFSPVLAKEPTNAAALGGRGESLWKLGRHTEAQADLLQAMESDPGFTLPFITLAGLLRDQGDIEMARRVLEAGLDQNPRDESLWIHLVGLSARRSPERVAADAWDALQAVPDGGKGIWHQIVIQSLLQRDSLAEAALVLQRGLEAFPGDPELKALEARLGL